VPDTGGMKHNNVVPNQHFRKDWQQFVRTWLDQPARKQARRRARVDKAKRIAPRPLDSLRPIVRGQTNKYNMKLRAGRGFTLDELKAAGVKRREARGIGIPTDYRRSNKSEETFQANVARLKLYRSKLVIFPRNPTSQKAKKGDSSKDEQKKAAQVTTKHVLPISAAVHRVKPRKTTDEERKTLVAPILHKARLDEKLWGAREKRAKDKREGKSGKKAAKKEAEDAGLDE